MSLEQQIADAAGALGAATAAANTLTGEVTGKINQINASVALATQNIAAKWADERLGVLRQTGFISLLLNHVSGDDSNDGITAPVRTMARLGAVAENYKPHTLFVSISGGGEFVVDARITLHATYFIFLTFGGIDSLRFPAINAYDPVTGQYLGQGHGCFSFDAPSITIDGDNQFNSPRLAVTLDPIDGYSGSGSVFHLRLWHGVFRNGQNTICTHEKYMTIVGMDFNIGAGGVLLAGVNGGNFAWEVAELLKFRSLECSYSLGDGASKAIFWTDMDNASWT
jgi:hypothetical protein